MTLAQHLPLAAKDRAVALEAMKAAPIKGDAEIRSR